MVYHTAIRSILSRQLGARAITAAHGRRTLSVSRRCRDDHGAPAPQLFGPGGKMGEIPTDYEQATGLERFELLMKLQGKEAFSMEPLQVPRMGTLKDPIMVASLDHDRILGCTGFPVDSHDTLLFKINDEKPLRCPECGCAYKVNYEGLPDDPHGHGHH